MTMIKGKIKELIIAMGFKLNEQNDYEGRFFDDNSGSIVKIIVKEEADSNGLMQLQFYGFDEFNNSLGSPCTLDQMMFSFRNHYMPVPEKSDKKYSVVYNLKVQVPVDMSQVDDKTYLENVGLLDPETLVAEEIAGKRLKDLFIYNSMNVIRFEWDDTQEVQ